MHPTLGARDTLTLKPTSVSRCAAHLGPELSSAAREAVLPAVSEDIVETTGSAGDILLTHPLLLHARCVCPSRTFPLSTRCLPSLCDAEAGFVPAWETPSLVCETCVCAAAVTLTRQEPDPANLGP